MKKAYAGMDIGSKECAAVVLDSRGKLVDAATFRTSERNLVCWGKNHAGTTVLIEECEIAGWVRSVLKPRVRQVVVSDPRQNAWIAKGTDKSDKVDAAKLAHLNRMGSYKEVFHTDDADIAAFKMLVKHYDKTTRRLAAVKSQIKGLLRGQGIITTGAAVYHSGRNRALSKVDGNMIRLAIEQDYALLDYLEAAQQVSRRNVVKASALFPIIARLKEIPGVGDITAARFVAYVADPHRFNKGALNRYSCLAVVDRTSGNSHLGRRCLNKDGNSALKDVSNTIFHAAISCTKPNGIKAFYAKSLRRTTDRDKARLNTQRKILALMLAIWRNEERYSDDRVTGRKRALPSA